MIQHRLIAPSIRKKNMSVNWIFMEYRNPPAFFSVVLTISYASAPYSRRNLRLQFVAHSPDRLDQFSLGSQFAPEFLDMRIYGPGIAKIVIVPNVIEDLLS